MQIDQQRYKAGKKLDFCIATDGKHRPTKEPRWQEQLYEGNDSAFVAEHKR
jgi:hypothetical protein